MERNRAKAMNALAAGGVCALYDPAYRADWADVLAGLQAVGVPWFQLRAKRSAPGERAAWAAASRRILDRAVLIINDDPELAHETGADGVHVGAGDPTPAAARVMVGDDVLIGATGSGDRWKTLDCTQIDYLGIGPLRSTRTKPDAPAPLGLDGLRVAFDAAGAPVLAIGGIAVGDVAGLRRAGAAGIAVQGAVWDAADPVAAAAAMLEAWRCA